MRVELLKKQLERDGHRCVVLNVGTTRRIPSPHYETVMSGIDYMRKVWRFSREGFVVHGHVNGESPKGFVLTLIAEAVNLLWGKRCVLTFHAGRDQPYFPRSKAPMLTPMYRLLFSIPKRIICNSAAVQALISEYGVPASKIDVIPAFSRQYLEFETVTLDRDLEAFLARFPVIVFTYVRIRPGFDLTTLLDAFARVARERPDTGLVFSGVCEDIDPALWAHVADRIACGEIADRVCIVGDLEHDAFLTTLSRAAVYLRTPVSDGVASSVLESLALRVPVLAAQNDARPAGVVTYTAGDTEDLIRGLRYVLSHRADIMRAAPVPEIRDTLADEIRVLTSVAGLATHEPAMSPAHHRASECSGRPFHREAQAHDIPSQ
jgi:glycosyltransferase involved in cell wall biosynthesis